MNVEAEMYLLCVTCHRFIPTSLPSPPYFMALARLRELKYQVFEMMSKILVKPELAPSSRKMQETSGVKKRESWEAKKTIRHFLLVLTPSRLALLSHALQDSLRPVLDTLTGKRPATLFLPKVDSVIKTV